MAQRHIALPSPVRLALSGGLVSGGDFIRSLLSHSIFATRKGMEARKAILSALDRYEKSQTTDAPALSFAIDAHDYRYLTTATDTPEFFDTRTGNYRDGFTYHPATLEQLEVFMVAIMSASLERPRPPAATPTDQHPDEEE